jgi:hypothetical protein
VRTRGRPRKELPPPSLDDPWKPCTRCGVLQPLSYFPSKEKGRDGRGSWCLECFRTYQRVRYDGVRKRQPTKDDLIQAIDAEPLTDREFLLRRERMAREAKEEGPRYCTKCAGPEKTRLRLGNRRRGVCDTCWERAV